MRLAKVLLPSIAVLCLFFTPALAEQKSMKESISDLINSPLDIATDIVCDTIHVFSSTTAGGHCQNSQNKNKPAGSRPLKVNYGLAYPSYTTINTPLRLAYQPFGPVRYRDYGGGISNVTVTRVAKQLVAKVVNETNNRDDLNAKTRILLNPTGEFRDIVKTSATKVDTADNQNVISNVNAFLRFILLNYEKSPKASGEVIARTREVTIGGQTSFETLKLAGALSYAGVDAVLLKIDQHIVANSNNTPASAPNTTLGYAIVDRRNGMLLKLVIYKNDLSIDELVDIDKTAPVSPEMFTSPVWEVMQKARAVEQLSGHHAFDSLSVERHAQRVADQARDASAKGPPSLQGFVIMNGTNSKGTEWHYTGESMGGKMTGYGVIEFTDGQKYEGAFFDGHKNGDGVQKWPDGDSYAGEFRDDAPNGYGVYFGGPTRKYREKVGWWTDGKLDGNGIVYWNDGSVTFSEWKNNEMNGYTVTISANRSSVEQAIYANGKVKSTIGSDHNMAN